MKMKRYNLIALFGKSGSGKTTVLNWLMRNFPEKLHKVVACTTRPLREGEEDGREYHFISVDEFTQKTLSGEMIEATSFRDWFYGTEISALREDKLNVAIFSPEALNCVLEDPRINTYPVYIYASDKKRLMRSLDREYAPDCYEICRRFLADEKDFAHIDEIEHQWWFNEYNSDLDDDEMTLLKAERLFEFIAAGQN